MSKPGKIGAAWVNLREATISRARRIAKRGEWSPYRVLPTLERATHVVAVLLYNEAPRIPFLLQYYRDMGFQHFIAIDNLSNDGTLEFLGQQPDVSIFRASGQYKKSRFGVDWVNGILTDYCVSKWVLHVDADEFLVFRECDSKDIAACTQEIADRGVRSLQCMMIDMYSERPSDQNIYSVGQHPLEVCRYFDKDGYERSYDDVRLTTWIKGGVRGRVFFPGNMDVAPALNKTPLVFWKRGDAFLRSAHQLSPPRLNEARSADGTLPYGALLHFKFTSVFSQKVDEEAVRKQHASEYAVYNDVLGRGSDVSFMSDQSVRYVDWRTLHEHRLI